MPKYQCTVYRNDYRTATVEVEADTPEDAAFMAETNHGGCRDDANFTLNAEDFECGWHDVEEITQEIEHAAAGHPVA